VDANALVDPGWLADRLGDRSLRVIEVDVSPASYEEGHIPGSVLWDAYRDLRHPDYTPVDADELDALLSRSGIAPENTVVLYGYAAHLGAWLLSCHGHESIRVIDGPRERWQASGHGWESEPPQPGPTAYLRSGGRPGMVLDFDALRAALGDPGTAIVDVRSAEEFNGERFWPSGATEGAGRAGRVPGAVHLPVELARNEDGSLADGERLRVACEREGITPDRRVVTYCTIGNRASQVALALEQLGYPGVAVYYGSWSEWGTRPDAPVET
jgi:thiosulfate/3-mercaptopyruvate sulfurtransferase